MRSILRVILNTVFVLNVFSFIFAQNTCNVTNYPRVGTPYPSSVHGTATIENISVYSDQTGVLLSYTTGQSSGGWISMASSTYILIKGEKHSIQAWGVLDSNGEFKELNFNEHYNVTPNTNYKFILFFPSIPVGIETVSIVEPNGFYWYGININNSTPLASSSNNNSTYSGVGSELIGTTFKVTNSKNNGEDQSSLALTNDQALHFYINNSGNFSFSNHWREPDSQSYGGIYGMKKTHTEETKDKYASTEYKFTWNYNNTYDDETGSAFITFTIIYMEDLIKFTCKIVVLDTNNILEYKGFLE